MGKILKWIMDRLVVQLILNLFVYFIHWVIIALPLTPAVLFLIWSWRRCFPTGELSFASAFQFSLSVMIAYFIFIVCGVVVFGVFIRILSLGFKEGKYDQLSWTMIRWLILSGINNFACDAILPQIVVSPFLNAFYILVGCKMGKDVRINTPSLYDSYLLELGDNVVLGGKATLTCHIFERGRLVLKRIKIGRNCVVGAHAYIHPGVVMEDNSAVGVYAMVPKDATIQSKTVHGHLPALPYRELARLTRFSKSKSQSSERGGKDGTTE